MHNQIEGKVALVTGGGRGIGRAIALALARHGADVAVTARTDSEIACVAEEIVELGGRAMCVPADVRRENEIDSVISRVDDELGGIDILVNNAGVAIFGPLAEMPLQDWNTVIETNVTGTFLFTRAALPGMKARGSGRIINIASIVGKKPYFNQGAYTASKHAVVGLTKVLAMELREHNILVHCICPGGVETRLTAEAMPDRDRSDFLHPDDVAHAVIFLLTLSSRATVPEIILQRPNADPM